MSILWWMFFQKNMHQTWHKLIQCKNWKNIHISDNPTAYQSLSITNTNHISFHVQHECLLRSFSKQSLTNVFQARCARNGHFGRFLLTKKHPWQTFGYPMNHLVTWSCLILKTMQFQVSTVAYVTDFTMSSKDFIPPWPIAFCLGHSKPQQNSQWLSDTILAI